MITPEILESLIGKLQLPHLGREYVKRVMNSPPSRHVMQAENHRHELALVCTLEYDPSVIAFWDQPEGITITYTTASGRPTSPTITPDYLVVRNDGILWIEVKPEAILPELSKEKPYWYVRGDDGKWHCPPAEVAARGYGFEYRIWTSSVVPA